MLKTFLIRLWQHITQAFARSQFDISLVVLDEADIDPMNTAVWVSSGTDSSQLGTYVKREDFKAISKGDWPNPPNDISALEQFKQNPKLKEAYQKAVEAYRKETGR